MNSSFVYAFIDPETGLVKIGSSKDPYRRLASQGGTRLKILGMLPGGLDKERRIHRRFKRFRIGRAEWFRPDPAIVQFFTDLPSPKTLAECNRVRKNLNLWFDAQLVAEVTNWGLENGAKSQKEAMEWLWRYALSQKPKAKLIKNALGLLE